MFLKHSTIKMEQLLGFELEYADKLDSKYDAVVIVGEKSTADLYPAFSYSLVNTVKEAAKIDKSLNSDVSSYCLSEQPITFLVNSPTGPLNRDYDDVRRFEEAAKKGIQKVLKSGKRAPLLLVQDSANLPNKRYSETLLVTLMGALEALYVPIEVREDVPAKKSKIDRLGFSSVEIKSKEKGEQFTKATKGIEIGRIIARDIGGSDPERMAPLKVAKYVSDLFENSNIKVKISDDRNEFVTDYPLFAAVDRCSMERHAGRIIYLEYTGENVNTTYMLVGKGVTYDTGGADIKAGGVMAGMHRDKCGAATIAGIFGTLSYLQPKGVKVVGRLAMVRNSVGSDAYVADEIITSAAGCRVRVGNTDAEGRMAMTDCLYHSKQQALNEVNPHLMTIATLTGHAIIAVGEAYTIMLDNGPAREIKFADSVQALGENLANPIEISTLRREDYNMVAGRNEYEDVIQCNNAASSRTPRGHQFPAAFMVRASGMDGHGIDSEKPLKYTHVDIAGSSGPYPGIPTAAPLVALVKLMKAF